MEPRFLERRGGWQLNAKTEAVTERGKPSKIVVVLKTHLDIGYTDLAENVMQHYVTTMLDDSLAACEATQTRPPGERFVWTMPSWALQYTLEHSSPERAERTRRLIAAEQIGWHALPYTTITEACGVEEWIRGLLISSELAAATGRTAPASGKMTDVPGYPRMLASLAAKAGIKFLHFGANPAVRTPNVPRLFFWEGPDGGRVLTFFSEGAYGTPLLPPADWPYPVWLALLITNDNAGPPTPDIVPSSIDAVRRAHPEAEVVFGTMDDFYEQLTGCCDLSPLPVVRTDLADTWTYGVASYPVETALVREQRGPLTAVEAMFTTALRFRALDGGSADAPRQSIRRAYAESLLFGEHTWGLVVEPQWGYVPHYEKETFAARRREPVFRQLERSWEEQRARARAARDAVGAAEAQLLPRIAALAAADGPRLCVANHLGWRRGGWVDLEQWAGRLERAALRDPASGETFRPLWRGGRLQAYCPELPACGYKVYEVVDDGGDSDSAVVGVSAAVGGGDGSAPSRSPELVADPGSGLLSNRWFELRLSEETGAVVHFLDKRNGKQWVDAAAEARFGQYRYDVYDMDDITGYLRDHARRFFHWYIDQFGKVAYPEGEHRHRTFVPRGFALTAEADEASATLIARAAVHGESLERFGDAAAVELRVTLYADEPCVDLRIALEGKAETLFAEAGHLAFPLALSPGYDVRYRSFGDVLDPAADIALGANHAMFCAEHWVDVADGTHGMAVVPIHTPLFSFGEPGVYRVRDQWDSQAEPVLLFNLFNNAWGTNFPQWIGGDMAFAYRLIPHEGDWRTGSVERLALETAAPLRAGFAEEPADVPAFPAAYDWLASDLDEMEALALKPAERVGGFVLRVRDLSGRARTAELAFAERWRRIAACDLLERETGAAAEDADRIFFHMGPFDILTFLLLP